MIGNFELLKNYKWIDKFKPEVLDQETRKFMDFVIEATFLIKTLFFILFGYSIEIKDLLDINSFTFSLIIIISIIVIRVIQLQIFKLSLRPLLFVIPKGLINILLFISIQSSASVLILNKAIIAQLIIISVIIMVLGLMLGEEIKKDNPLK